MTLRARPVAVKRLPTAPGAKQERMFLLELESCLNGPRPCIVLDCAEALQMKKPEQLLLLRCLEEAMKRNGDVRLAAVGPGARDDLKAAGIDRLFKIFDTTAEAIDSFQRPWGFAGYVEERDAQPAADAA
jgi:hypothetical protein